MLKQLDIRLKGPDSSDLRTLGSIECNIDIGNQTIRTQLIVANVTPSMILGSPFLKQNGVSLNLKKEQLSLEADPTRMLEINTIDHSIGIAVKAIGDQYIPPWMSQWIEGMICGDESKEYKEGIILPIITNGTPIQRVINDPITKHKVSLLMFNATDAELEIQDDQEIGIYKDTPENTIFLEEVSQEQNQGEKEIHHLNLSVEEEEKRWTLLCQTLKEDEWEITEEEKGEFKEALKPFQCTGRRTIWSMQTSKTQNGFTRGRTNKTKTQTTK